MYDCTCNLNFNLITVVHVLQMSATAADVESTLTLPNSPRLILLGKSHKQGMEYRTQGVGGGVHQRGGWVGKRDRRGRDGEWGGVRSKMP